MNILCKWFGHKSIKGAWGSTPYARIKASSVDGIGREHAFLYVECARCGKEFKIVNLHLPTCKRCEEREKNEKENRLA